MKEYIKKKFEGLLIRVKGISWKSLLSFTIGLIVLVLLPNEYREAGIEGLIFVGASLILLKGFIVKK